MRSLSSTFWVCLLFLVSGQVESKGDSVDARFDNLTTDLGLNDNFDDGVINTDLWSVEKARVGYGIWQLPNCDPPPFIAASEQGGKLRMSGNTCEYYDYSRVLISKQSFSGPFTLEVDLTSLSGTGTQWGAGVAVVKDGFSSIQVSDSVHHWMAWNPGDHVFSWRARHSCISGTPGCPPSPGFLGAAEIDDAEVYGPGALVFPIRLKIVYDGGTQFQLSWIMNGVEYQDTHIAPEVYGAYRIVLHGSARLGDVGPTVPALDAGGLTVLVFAMGALVLRFRARCRVP